MLRQACGCFWQASTAGSSALSFDPHETRVPPERYTYFAKLGGLLLFTVGCYMLLQSQAVSQLRWNYWLLLFEAGLTHPEAVRRRVKTGEPTSLWEPWFIVDAEPTDKYRGFPCVHQCLSTIARPEDDMFHWTWNLFHRWHPRFNPSQGGPKHLKILDHLGVQWLQTRENSDLGGLAAATFHLGW